MRDWRDALPASFKGFTFEVKSDSLTAGRNIPVHEYIRSEEIDTEDMGRKATKWSVTAYIASDSADAEASAFVSLCTSPGEGLLALPDQTPEMARCVSIKRSAESDRLGYIAFELEFVEAGGGGDFVTPLSDLLGIASAASFVSAAVALLATLSLSSSAGAVAQNGAQAALTALPALASTPDAALIVANAANASALAATPAARVSLAVEAIRAVGDVTGADASHLQWIAVADAIAASDAATASPALALDHAPAGEALALLQAAAWQEAALAAALRPGLTRDVAQSVRARIANGSDAILGRLAAFGDQAPFQAFATTMAHALDAIDTAALRLDRAALIQTPRSMPSTAVAWLLYQDPSRAADLASVSEGTPLFMPQEFIAAVAP